ncbi:FAD-dependent oxidoreductase, partial [Streptomyces decoyicus]
EGPVHFAGEHVSLKHAWIEGAVETAVRAAIAVNEAPAADESAFGGRAAAPRERRGSTTSSDQPREDVLTS